jgi:hypothetical protein
MNMNTSNAHVNGGPSTHVPNGGILKPGGLALLRMPVVVVLNSNLFILFL